MPDDTAETATLTPADTRSPSERAGRLMRLATYASVSVAVILVGTKLMAWLMTDSVSLLSTLIDSLLDAGASLLNLLAVRHALEPADKEHRFGHGKAEALAGLAQAAFICGSAVFLLFEASERLVHPRVIFNTGIGYGVMILAIVLTLILVAFQRYNLQPGPLLFQNSSDLVWALIASLYIGNVMLLVLNLPLIRIWVKILSIPKPMLYTGILVFATLGVYSVSNSLVDLLIMYIIGVLGFFMRRLDIPVAPMVLGVILGQLMEVQFRRAMAASQGDITVFVTRPFALTLLLFAVAAVVLPYAPGLWARLRGRGGDGGRFDFGGGGD